MISKNDQKPKKPLKRMKSKPAKASALMAKRRPGRVKADRPPHNATWLKAQLLIAGITQRDIAAELGADFSTVSHLVSGRRPMRPSDIECFARMLNMPVARFLAGVRDTKAPAIPAGLQRAIESGEIRITGWVDGHLVVHEGTPRGPTTAPALPDGSEVKVLRCQTQGSVFDGLDGALVYYSPSETVEADAVGHMCVVKVVNGPSLLRVVKRGYQAGRFNLSVLNGVQGEEDAHLANASPVVWLKM